MKRLLCLCFILCFWVTNAHGIELVRQRGIATRIVFPMVDADGDTVSGIADGDTEIDKFADGSDPDGFADINSADEIAEIGTTGVYQVTLDATDMTADYVIIRCSGTGAKTQHILIRTIYGDPLNLATIDDTTAATAGINVTSGAIDTVTTTTTATNVTNAVNINSNADITAILADTAAVDTTTEMRTFLTGGDTALSTLTTGSTIAGVTTASTCTALGAGAVNAAAIADDAIDAGAIATGAIISTTFQAGAITAGAIATDAIGSAEIATDAIGAAEIATAAIGADEIATDAIGSAELAATAATEIANATALTNGQCQGGSTVNNIVLAAAETAIDDEYNQCLVVIYSGTGNGQARLITDYTGDTDTAIVDRPWVIAPTSSSYYRIFAFSGILLSDTGLALGGSGTTINLNTSAPAGPNSLVGSTVYISGGTGAGQARIITAYDASEIATISPAWTTNPDVTSIYKILPVGRVYVNAIAPGIITSTEAPSLQYLTGDAYSLLNTAVAEPAQGACSTANISPVNKIGCLDKFRRNKVRQSSSLTELYNFAGDTVDEKSEVSDDGTYFSRGVFVSGP